MQHVEQYIRVETASICSLIDCEKIEQMAQELVALRERRGRLFIVGLGGSAANASHAVNDFRKLCGIDAISPLDNVSELTARANDEGWHRIFFDCMDVSRANVDDAILILSVGGGSEKVSTPISFLLECNKAITVLGIVGRDGGDTAKYARCCIIIPTVKSERVTPHCEGWQSVILHALVSHPDLQKAATKW